MTTEEQQGALGWTDGSIIYLPVKTLLELQRKIRLKPKAMQTIVNAIVYHESGHVLLSDFQLWGLFMTMFKTEYPEGWRAIQRESQSQDAKRAIEE